MGDVVNILLMCVGWIAGLILLSFIFMLYAKNLYKVVQTLKGRTAISVRTPIRIAGVFFPLLGIAMGLIKGE